MEILLADIKNRESVDRVVSSTKVIIAAVGPYALHGKDEPPLLSVVNSAIMVSSQLLSS